MRRPAPATTGSVSIKIVASHAFVQADGEAQLFAHPALRFRQLQANSRGTPLVVSESFAKHFSGRPTAGLATVLAAAAESLNIDVSVRLNIPAPLGRLVRFASRQRQDPAVVAFVGANGRGLIWHDAGVDFAWCIAQIAMSYPRAKIAVLVPSFDKARSLRKRLRKFGNFLSEMYSTFDDQPIRRVVVGVIGEFGDGTLEFEQRDLVIFPEAHHALHQSSLKALSNADNRFRLVGFISRQRPIARSEEEYLRGTFGFAEILVPSHGRVELPVHFWLARFRSRNAIPNRRGIAAMRTLYWRNNDRNCFLADVARRFLQVGIPGRSTSARVIVLTATVEHALEMRQFLQAWPVVGSDINLDGLDAHECTAVEAGLQVHTEPCNQMIATIDGLAQLSSTTSDTVILWAGGGESGPVIPRQILAHRYTSADTVLPQVVIIDVDDDSGPLMRVWAKRRKQAYERGGCLPFGMSEIEGRGQSFLKRHRRS